MAMRALISLPMKVRSGQRRALLALAFEEIGDALLVEAGIQFGSLIFGAPDGGAGVQANVGDDAVEPGVKAALEAETVRLR